MLKYPYILFDWDGTLAQTLDVWFKTLKASLEKRNYNFSDSEIGADYAVFAGRFTAKGYTGAEPILDEALHQADIDIANVSLYPSALDTLQSLHNLGVTLGLVTTSVHAQIDPLLKRFGLIDLFDCIVCGDDTKRQKPDPAPVIKAMTMLGAPPAHTILVGDSENDIIAAERAGISSLLFYPPSHKKFYDISALELLKPTYVAHGHHEIIHLIG